ncbi:hypothetical protein [Brevundimonas sp.]
MTEVWFLIVAWGWIASVILASVVYRRIQGKPIFARSPTDRVFEENRTSGRELGSIREIGGAKNALKVCVTRDNLHVMPCFPFSLMFLPEVWGLEHRIGLKQIDRIERRSGILGRSLILTVRNGVRLELRLRNPEGLLMAIEQGGGPSVEPAATS